MPAPIVGLVVAARGRLRRMLVVWRNHRCLHCYMGNSIWTWAASASTWASGKGGGSAILCGPSVR